MYAQVISVQLTSFTTRARSVSLECFVIFLVSVCFRRCMAGLSFIVCWKDVKEKFILNSLSRTWRLGKAVLRARHNKESPVDSILQHENGKLLITGKVVFK